MAPPFREAEFEILYGSGINKIGELVDTGERLGLVDKAGTWYSYAGTKLGQGRDRAVAAFEENPPLAQQLREALIKQSRAANKAPPVSLAA
jgi:recombination protein RecA